MIIQHHIGDLASAQLISMLKNARFFDTLIGTVCSSCGNSVILYDEDKKLINDIESLVSRIECMCTSVTSAVDVRYLRLYNDSATARSAIHGADLIDVIPDYWKPVGDSLCAYYI